LRRGLLLRQRRTGNYQKYREHKTDQFFHDTPP
jgi:hypothetical protein